MKTPELTVLEQRPSYWQVQKMLQFGIHLDGQVIFPVYLFKDCTQKNESLVWHIQRHTDELTMTV